MIGRWIRSLDTSPSALSTVDLDSYTPPRCHTGQAGQHRDFPWVDQDYTGGGGPYTPRRQDWNDPQVGMPLAYRELKFDAGLSRLPPPQWPWIPLSPRPPAILPPNRL